jgi:malonyl-CoA O-methyltransferase
MTRNTDTPQNKPPLDAIAAERWQHLAWAQSDKLGTPWLHQEVGRRMAQRLQWITAKPQRWTHWRAWHSGALVHAQIAAQYPNSEAFLAPDLVEYARTAMQFIATESKIAAWLGLLTGRTKDKAQRMSQPQPPGSAQMLWANMALHTEADPAGVIAQWHKLLAVDGFLMFSCLGPDTALELRQLYAQMGWGQAAHPLTDMHDWGDLLVGSGFAEPIMDMERIVLTFATPERALQELRGIGRNLHPARYNALRTRAWRKQLLQAMDAHLRNRDGQIELTFEVIYGHAFKPTPRLKMSSESAISMQDMRAMLAKKPDLARPASSVAP